MIRLLTPGDAAQFQSLRLRALLECPDAFSASHAEEAILLRDVVASRLAAGPCSAVLGHFLDGSLVAMTGVERAQAEKLAHKAVLRGLYVAPPFRKSGLARGLVKAALEHAVFEWGVIRVNLGVNTKNHAAFSLYESIGFRIFGTEPGYLCVNGVLHDEHHMTWVAPQGAG